MCHDEMDEFPSAVRLKAEVALAMIGQPGVSVASIAQNTGLPVSTVMRIIAALVQAKILDNWPDLR